jgi:hypothetical protein
VVTAGDALTPLPLYDESGKPNGTVVYVQGAQDSLAGRLLTNLAVPVLLVGARAEADAVALLLPHFSKVKGVSSVSVRIVADGHPFIPSDAVPVLITPELAWLKDVLVLAMEFRSRVSVQRREQFIRAVLGRLSRVRLRHTGRLAVAVDEHDAELPASLRSAMPVKDARYPTLLVVTEDAVLDWEATASMDHALAQLVEQPSLAAELQLAVIQLVRLIGAGSPRTPTVQEFSQVFGVRQERVAEIRREVRSAIPVVLESLRPILWHFAGPSAVATLPGPDDPGITEEVLLAALASFSASLPLPTKQLLHECGETTDLGALRDRLGIGYADFNAALKALGLPYRPIHNVEGHRNAFSYFKQQQRERILRALRTHFLKVFEGGAPLDAYVVLRGMDTLLPDSAWLDRCDLPDDTLMERRLAAWLTEAGVCEPGERGGISPRSTKFGRRIAKPSRTSPGGSAASYGPGARRTAPPSLRSGGIRMLPKARCLTSPTLAASWTSARSPSTRFSRGLINRDSGRERCLCPRICRRLASLRNF